MGKNTHQNTQHNGTRMGIFTGQYACACSHGRVEACKCMCAGMRIIVCTGT